MYMYVYILYILYIIYYIYIYYISNMKILPFQLPEDDAADLQNTLFLVEVIADRCRLWGIIISIAFAALAASVLWIPCLRR